jgi:hypothetical protein
MGPEIPPSNGARALDSWISPSLRLCAVDERRRDATMRRCERRSAIASSFLPRALLLGLATATAAVPAAAAPEINGEDYRLFCGYLDAMERPNIQAIKNAKQREQKVAKMAKINVKKLKAAVDKVQQVGATCDEVGKKIEADAGEAVKKALPGRVALYLLDFDDPDHVVAAVTWKGGDKKLLEEEASLLASVLAKEAPIVRTIAVRAINPLAADKESDEATWFEAKINRERAARIEPDKIKDFADTRYIRLFDNVVRK